MSIIYIAAAYSRREELLKYKKDLEDFGHTVNARWLDTNNDEKTLTEEEKINFSRQCLNDVYECRWFILFFSEECRGALIELGYVIGLSYCVNRNYGHRLSIIGGPALSIFFSLIPKEERYVNWDNFMYRNFWMT